MELSGLIGDIFGKYQAHIFSALLFLIRMQFKANKNFEVHQKECDGKFILQDEINKTIKEDVKDNEDNIVELFRGMRAVN